MSNISLDNPPSVSSTTGPKGFSVNIDAQQVPHSTREAETVTQCPLAMPQVGTLFQHPASSTQPPFLAQGGYHKLNSLENLPLKSRINIIAYVTGVTEVKKSAGGDR